MINLYLIETFSTKCVQFISDFMLSKKFLTKRGYCCGNGCFMCPYQPRHIKDNVKLISKKEWKEHRLKNS